MKRDVVNKKLFLSIAILLSAIFLVSFIFGQQNVPGTLDDNVGNVANSLAGAINQFYLGVGLTTQNWTLIMLGVLLWMVVYSVIRNMQLFQGEYTGTWSAFFSLIVTILAFIGIPQGFVEGILVQYQAMGATIVTVIPFLIMFYFTVFVARSKLIARAVWLVYTVYYFSLFIYYISVNTTATGNFLTPSNLPYFGGFIIGLIVFIYLGFFRRVAFGAELDSKIEAAENEMKKRTSLDRLKGKEAREVFDNRR